VQFRSRRLSAAILAVLVVVQGVTLTPSAHASFGPQTIAQSLPSSSNLVLPSASPRGEIDECEQRIPLKAIASARAFDRSSRVRSQSEQRSTAFGFMEFPRPSTAHVRARSNDDPDAH